METDKGPSSHSGASNQEKKKFVYDSDVFENRGIGSFKASTLR